LVAVAPVRLPGRETRAAEPAFERMGSLIEALIAEMQPFLDTPFLLFGHSMGAGIAFELARALRSAGLRQPLALHVSGARAPQYRLNHVPPPEPSLRDFIEELRRLEGFPPSVLNNPELLKLALPALLSDARLYRHYAYTAGEPFSMPVFAYGGEADPNVTTPHLDAWKAQTTGLFQRRDFHGGHFYLETSQAALLAALKVDITLASQVL
jgi:surfactin synthase thioesterase subunit